MYVPERKSLSSVFALLLLSLFVVPFTSSAQTPPVGVVPRPAYVPAAVSTSTKNVVVGVVANVNLRGCTIIARSAPNFTISCGVANTKGIQPDVHYSVKLIRQEGKNRVTVDEKIYPEVLVLPENKEVRKTIDYVMPGYVRGKVEMWVTLYTSDGVSLANAYIDRFDAVSGDGFAEIIPESCFLRVAGEEGRKYTILQGVDIDLEEKLIAYCDVQNIGSQPMSFVPHFATHYRLKYGPQVLDTADPQQTFTLATGEKKNFSFAMPKALEPQAYDAVLQLRSANSEKISNPVALHYVLRGAGATVQNIVTDKDRYVAGDTAHITTLWTPSADTHRNRRKPGTDAKPKAILAVLADVDRKQCASPARKEIPANILERSKSVEFDIGVTRDCVNPNVTITITDVNDKILVRKFVSLVSQEEIDKAQKLSGSMAYGAIAIFGIIGILVLLWFVFKKHHTPPPVAGLFFALFLSVGMLWGASAKADTFTAVFDILGDGSDVIYSTFTVNLDKATYAPGESIAATGLFVDGVCSDGSLFGGSLNAVNDADAASQGILYSAWNGQQNVVWFTAPSTPGTYTVTFYGWSAQELGLAETPTPYPITYTVVPAGPTNGACGPANATPVSSAPVGGHCSAGAPTAVAGGGPWTWTCLGAGGGSDSPVCTAPYTPPYVPPPSPYSCGTWQMNMSPNSATEVVLDPSVYIVDYSAFAATCESYATTNGYSSYACGLVDDGCVEYADCDYFIMMYYGYCEPVVYSYCNSHLSISPDPVLVPAINPSFTGAAMSCNPNPSAVVTGACGSAAGTAVVTIPTSGFCNSGNPTVISGSGPWTWTCLGAGGGSDSPVCTAPIAATDIDLKVNGSDGPVSALNTDTLTLTWTMATNPTGMTCTASGAGWSGPVGTSGSTNIPASVTTTYTISCNGPMGPGSDSVVVTVTAPTPVVTLSAQSSVGSGSAVSASYGEMGPGARVNWTSSVSSASCTLYRNGSSVWWGTSGASGSYNIATGLAAGQTNFRLECVNGPSIALPQSVTFTVPNKPTITDIGPGMKFTGTSYPFDALGTDNDGDALAYQIDWGDGSPVGTTPWPGTVPSGTPSTGWHTWNTSGVQSVRARIVDVNGAYGEWGNPISVAITGLPVLSVSGVFHDFDIDTRTEVNTTEVDTAFLVSNTGSSAMIVTLALSGGYYSLVAAGQPTSFVVPANTLNVPVHVAFSPLSTTIPQPGSVTVTATDGYAWTAVPVTVVLQGSGIFNVALPASNNFGDVVVITPPRYKDKTLTFRNNGAGTLGSGSVLFNPPSAEYSCISSSAGMSGPTCQYNLVPGATNTFTIRFQPSGLGTFNANLELAGSAFPVYAITGRGIPPDFNYKER